MSSVPYEGSRLVSTDKALSLTHIYTLLSAVLLHEALLCVYPTETLIHPQLNTHKQAVVH